MVFYEIRWNYVNDKVVLQLLLLLLQWLITRVASAHCSDKRCSADCRPSVSHSESDILSATDYAAHRK